MLRRLVRLVLATAVCAGAFVAITGPAQAGTSDCKSGYLCLWEDQNFQTNGSDVGWWRTSTYNAHLGSAKYNGFNNDYVGDSATSGFNHTSSTIYLFVNASCTGSWATETTAWSDSNFGNGSPTFYSSAYPSKATIDISGGNNRVSSVAVGSGNISTCRAH